MFGDLKRKYRKVLALSTKSGTNNPDMANYVNGQASVLYLHYWVQERPNALEFVDMLMREKHMFESHAAKQQKRTGDESDVDDDGDGYSTSTGGRTGSTARGGSKLVIARALEKFTSVMKTSMMDATATKDAVFDRIGKYYSVEAHATLIGRLILFKRTTGWLTRLSVRCAKSLESRT